jgi:hypothetical protein
MMIYYLYIDSYMFRSYDHHQDDFQLKTHIIRYHTRNRMQTPQIKFMVGVRISIGTGSRPAVSHNQPPFQWVLLANSSGTKRLGREADHSPPSNAEVKNSGAIPPLLNASS